MKTPDEFRIPIETGKIPLELTAQMKWNIAETITRIKEDGIDLGAGDFVDVEDLEYICKAASYLMLYAQQLEAELDALLDAVKDFGGSCATCEHYSKAEDDIPCRFCVEMHPEDEDKVSHWQWRGVQKEEKEE